MIQKCDYAFGIKLKSIFITNLGMNLCQLLLTNCGLRVERCRGIQLDLIDISPREKYISILKQLKCDFCDGNKNKHFFFWFSFAPFRSIEYQIPKIPNEPICSENVA